MNTPLQALQIIPGIGPKLAWSLLDLGIRQPEDLIGADPEDLYQRLCQLRHCRVDRCVLYVFRCAVYYASCPQPDPRLLLWWNWKDSPASRKSAKPRRVSSMD